MLAAVMESWRVENPESVGIGTGVVAQSRGAESYQVPHGMPSSFQNLP